MTEWMWHYDSPLGGMTMASDGAHLLGLWFDGQARFPDVLIKGVVSRNFPIFEETVRWLDLYFLGGKPDFLPPFLLRGTPFQKEVWEILLTIPYGKTMTYGEIAAILARRKGLARMSAQAVGGAVGRNPLTLLVPCHRVVGADGSLTGYAGGIARKAALLALEREGAVRK